MNAPSLAHQRCFHHTLREAVARCPECGHFYCRECITEHEDQVICASCLGRSVTAKREAVGGVRWGTWLGPVLSCAVGLLLLWLFFYGFGVMLLEIPAKFHEGTVWVDRWLSQ